MENSDKLAQECGFLKAQLAAIQAEFARYKTPYKAATSDQKLFSVVHADRHFWVSVVVEESEPGNYLEPSYPAKAIIDAAWINGDWVEASAFLGVDVCTFLEEQIAQEIEEDALS